MRIGIWMAIVALYVVLNVIFSFADGAAAGSGPASTLLTVSLSATQVGSMTVTSTANFASAGYLVVGLPACGGDEECFERINYTAKTGTTFTGLTRGATWHNEGTLPTAYAPGAFVFNEVGYNLYATTQFSVTNEFSPSVFGFHPVTIPVPNIGFFVRVVGQYATFDYSIFDESLFFEGDLRLVRIFLAAVVGMALLISTTALLLGRQ